MEDKWIWQQWYGQNMEMICPICSQNKMKFNEKTITWMTGMIIGKREGGMEKYPNMIAICSTCVQIMQMENGGVIDYMMYIGKMSQQEGNEIKNRIYQETMNYIGVCPIIKKNGMKCTRMKCGKDIHMCEAHYNDRMKNEIYSTPMDLDNPIQNPNSYYF